MESNSRTNALKAFIAYTSAHKKEEDIRKSKLMMEEQLIPLAKAYFLAKENVQKAVFGRKDIPQEIAKFVEQRVCRLGIWEECSLLTVVDKELRQKLNDLAKQSESDQPLDGSWEKFCSDTFIAKNDIEYLLKKYRYCLDESNARAAYKAECLQQLKEQLIIAKEAYHKEYGIDYSRENLNSFVAQYAKNFDDAVWAACGYTAKFRYVFTNNEKDAYLTLMLERRDPPYPSIVLSENINLSL